MKLTAVSSLLANSQGQSLPSHGAGVAKRALDIFDVLAPPSPSNPARERLRLRLRVAAFWAAISHDIGKSEASFQSFMRSKKRSVQEEFSSPDAELSNTTKDVKIPFHNELSWAFLSVIEALFVSSPSGPGLLGSHLSFLGAPGDLLTPLSSRRAGITESDPSVYFADLVMMPVYWHHKLNEHEDKHKEPRFPTLSSLFNAFKLDEAAEFVLLAIGLVQASLQKLGADASALVMPSHEDVIDWIEGKTRTERLVPRFYPSADENLQIDADSIVPPSGWRHTRAKSWQQKLVLHVLVEADRQISQLSAPQLEAYLAGNYEMAPFGDDLARNRPQLAACEGERSLAQEAVARTLIGSRVGVCAADPGAGKTAIAAIAHALSHEGNAKTKRLFVALPQQQQIDGLYITMRKEMQRLGLNDLELEGVYGGSLQHLKNTVITPHHELLSSDICLLTIDRLLSPSFSWRQEEIMGMLLGNVVVDEFHAIAYIERIIPAFLDLIEMKKFCSGGGFLICLSGTPNPALLTLAGLPTKEEDSTNEACFVPRSALPPVHEEPSFFRVVEATPGSVSSQTLISTADLPDDTLVAHLKRRDSQEHLINLHKASVSATLVHSSFTNSDRKRKIGEILVSYGTRSAATGVVVSAKLLNASFDLNFKNVHNVAHTADYDCQIFARKNRHGGKPNGEVVLYLTAADKKGDRSFFDEEKFGFVEHHAAWNKHLLSQIGTSPKALNHREAMLSLYDGFWADAKNVRDFAVDLFAAAVAGQNYLAKSWKPIRGKAAATSQQKESKSSNDNGSFRGSSLLCTAIVVDDVKNELSQITGSDLLTESLEWAQKSLCEVTTHLVRDKTLGSAINLNGSFEFNKRELKFNPFKLGRSTKSPLIWSIIGSHHGAVIPKNDADSAIPPRYYHAELGLVETDLLNDYILFRTAAQRKRQNEAPLTLGGFFDLYGKQKRRPVEDEDNLMA